MVQPPPGYRGCDEFVGKEQRKCVLASLAARKLSSPQTSDRIWDRIGRALDRRRVRKSARYMAALRKQAHWYDWLGRTYPAPRPPAPGDGCSGVRSSHRHECERLRAQQRPQMEAQKAQQAAWYAARNAADPHVQYFKRYVSDPAVRRQLPLNYGPLKKSGHGVVPW